MFLLEFVDIAFQFGKSCLPFVEIILSFNITFHHGIRHISYYSSFYVLRQCNHEFDNYKQLILVYLHMLVTSHFAFVGWYSSNLQIG